MIVILYDKQDNVNYRIYNVFDLLCSVYYDGVESTAQYSLLMSTLHRLLFYSYSSSFVNMYFYSTRTTYFGR